MGKVEGVEEECSETFWKRMKKTLRKREMEIVKRMRRRTEKGKRKNHVMKGRKKLLMAMSVYHYIINNN